MLNAGEVAKGTTRVGRHGPPTYGDVGLHEARSCCRATSAASSLALLMYWPSYQKRA